MFLSSNNFYHVTLNELELELAKRSISNRIVYLKDAVVTVNSLSEDRLYVSEFDVKSEQNDLLKVQSRKQTLLSQKESFSQDKLPKEVQKEISDLNSFVDRYNSRVDVFLLELESNISEQNRLWKANVPLELDIRRTTRAIEALKLEVMKQNFKVLTEKYVADPLPKRILSFSPKKLRRELIKHRKEQALKEQQWRQNLVNQLNLTKKEVSRQTQILRQQLLKQYPLIQKISDLEYAESQLTVEIKEYKRLIRNVKAKIYRRKRSGLTPILRELLETELIEQVLSATIKRKVKSTLQRVQLNFYIIIREKKNVEYTRKDKTNKDDKKQTVKVSYPKGKFQVIMNCDSFTEPNTDTILSNVDPLQSLLPDLKIEACETINENFTIKTPFNPGQVTVGATNADLGTDDLGTPPELVSFARSTNDAEGEGYKRDSRFSSLNSKDWESPRNSSLMSQQEYNRFIASMKDYVQELKRLGKYRTGIDEY